MRALHSLTTWVSTSSLLLLLLGGAATGHARPTSSDPSGSPCTSNAECLRLGQPLLRPRLRRDGTSFSQQFDYTGSVQSFTVATAGNYFVSVAGGQGGNVFNYAGGRGAQLNTSISLNSGDVVDVYVAGQGQAGSVLVLGGGGGGSFFVINGNVYIAVGGGSGATLAATGMDAPTVLADGSGEMGAPYDTGGNGGQGGGGGSAGQYGSGNGGGGGGVSLDGQSPQMSPNQGGKSLMNGLAGGASTSPSGGRGGYGGGGGAGAFGSGGGGGYSGGGGGSGDPGENSGQGSAGGAGGNYWVYAGTVAYTMGGHDGNGVVVVQQMM